MLGGERDVPRGSQSRWAGCGFSGAPHPALLHRNTHGRGVLGGCRLHPELTLAVTGTVAEAGAGGCASPCAPSPLLPSSSSPSHLAAPNPAHLEAAAPQGHQPSTHAVPGQAHGSKAEAKHSGQRRCCYRWGISLPRGGQPGPIPTPAPSLGNRIRPSCAAAMGPKGNCSVNPREKAFLLPRPLPQRAVCPPPAPGGSKPGGGVWCRCHPGNCKAQSSPNQSQASCSSPETPLVPWDLSWGNSITPSSPGKTQTQPQGAA